MSALDQIKPGSHAIFEASAGTGKTYTVEQLVLRFLRNGVPLEQILIVTYTEKAAAELQDRLRSAITAVARDVTQSSETMTHALERYDDAQIFTIHAFCLRILQQFPFDHGHNPRAKMTADDEVMAACLREVQRGQWPAAYQKDLTSLLAVARFNLDSGGSEWDKKISRLANSFRPDCNHKLEPDQTIAAQDLRDLREHFTAELAEITRLAGAHDPKAHLHQHPFYVGYGQLKFNSTWRDSRCRKYLVPILLWISDPESKVDAIASFARAYNACISADKKFDGFDVLSRDAKQVNTACQHLEEICQRLDALRARLAQIEYVLASGTIKDLLNHMDRYKQERGLHSFEDFLTRVARALKPEFNPRAADLIRTLRKKYRVAIVDEFQDTDPLQWSIFKTIFVDDTDEHQLVLVGDPKQAIYSFRNADVNTYLQAREELKMRGANVVRLETNFRSCVPLVHGLNTLFRDGTFFPGNSGIGYDDVLPAPDGSRPETTLDQTGRKAITVVNFPPDTSGAAARRQMSQFVAEEIARLLRPQAGKPMLAFENRGKEEIVRADSIAVLLFRRAESRWIEEQLRQRGIPFIFYKKTGIWQSDEAIHLNIVLKALARTDQPALFREMLLTRFFGVRPEDVAAFEHSSQTDLLHRLFLRWRELCDRRRWAELFRSILEDTGTLSAEFGAFDGSRRVANFRYITQELSRAAYERGLSLIDIVDLLQHKRMTSGEDESGLQPLETERPTVKLMTIHASKGLEFPIVFLAGGFTGKKVRSFLKYHDDSGRLVFNLDSSHEAGKEKAKQEEREESHRLLYVALTRAMLKLYIPSVPKSRFSDGVVSEILTPALTTAKLDHSEYAGFIPPPPRATAGSPSTPVAAVIDEHLVKIKLAEPLMPGVDLGRLALRRVELQSFSRLVHHTPVVQIPVLDRPARADDDARPEELAKDDLPPGAAAGDVLHSLIETIEFATVRDATDSAALLVEKSIPRLLIERSLRTNMPEGADDPDVFSRRSKRVAELVWNALRTPLPQLKGTPLSALEPRQRLHELEFHMPFQMNPGKNLPAEVSAGEGFMTGFMDLVFTHGGRYFLLDWKSNSLASYTADDLARDMDARQYHLQYRIYLQALSRWLRVTHKTANPASLIGGVLYIYLRGMNVADPTRGVFFREPTADDFDERTLADALRAQAFAGRSAP